MKKIAIGIFASRADAEKAINHLHNELDVDNEDISYIYKNTSGETKEIDADDISSDTPGEGARKGAAIGGTIGALAGIAAVAGMIPVVGPFFAAGPILAALGIGGAVGTTAAGAVAGAAAGGLIGALTNLGIGKEQAQEYEDRVNAGDILVAAQVDNEVEAEKILNKCNATSVDIFNVTL